MKPWVSIVTVVKNDYPSLLRTRASLESQTSQTWEHVVVAAGERTFLDAASDLLRGCASTHLIEEPGDGPYPAMNEGLLVATGQYIQFLNAGDTYLGTDSLAQAESSRDWGCWAVAGFEVGTAGIYKRFEAPLVIDANDIAFFRARICHQATLYRRDFLNIQGGFRSDFAIAADYDLHLRLAAVAIPQRLPVTLAVFELGGLSTSHRARGLREAQRARRDALYGGEVTSPLAVRQSIEMARLRVGRALESVTGGHGQAHRSLWRRIRP